MKKEWLGWGLGSLALAFMTFFFFQGCTSSVPTVSSVVPPALPVDIISNFHEGSLLVNPALTNGTGGYFTGEVTGGVAGHTNMINGSLNPIILVPRPDTGQYAVHIYGEQTDTNPTEYPAIELWCFLRNNPNDPTDPYIYDLSQFPTGIQFDINILPDDTNTARWFQVGITANTPAGADPAGICPPPYSANCYNYFNFNLPSGSTSGWKHMTLPFSSMKIRFSPTGSDGLTTQALSAPAILYGQPVSVNGQPVASFENLGLFLLWQFSNGGPSPPPGAPGVSTYTDFWVDNVQFY